MSILVPSPPLRGARQSLCRGKPSFFPLIVFWVCRGVCLEASGFSPRKDVCTVVRHPMSPPPEWTFDPPPLTILYTPIFPTSYPFFSFLPLMTLPRLFFLSMSCVILRDVFIRTPFFDRQLYAATPPPTPPPPPPCTRRTSYFSFLVKGPPFSPQLAERCRLTPTNFVRDSSASRWTHSLFSFANPLCIGHLT